MLRPLRREGDRAVSAQTIERPQRGAAAFDKRPVGVYGRISKRKAGDGRGATLGIGRQHDDGGAYARREFGADVALVFYRDNLSAWSPTAVRDEYDQMLSDLRDGKLRAIVAWHPDRLTRQPEQLEQLLKACAAGEAQLHTCSTGHVESALMLRILLAVAAEESDHKSRRLTRKHEEIAMDGKWHGGPRPFGYVNTPDGLVVAEDEAAVVREAAALVLNGSSLASIARKLNADGVTTAQGKAWQPQNLRRMLMRPLIAGLRVQRDVVVADAAWPAIVDRPTHELLAVKLGDPGRRTAHSNARVYLLAGLALCNVCDAVLRGRPFGGGGRDGERRAYACSTGRHVHAAVDGSDFAVEALIVEHLTRRGAAALVDDAAQDEVDALRDERDQLDGRLAALLDQYLDGKLGERAYAAAESKVAERQAALDELIAEQTVVAAAPKVLDGMTGPGAQAAWDAATLAHRRSVIAYLCTIRLRGQSSTGRRFDPELDVLVDWH